MSFQRNITKRESYYYNLAIHIARIVILPDKYQTLFSLGNSEKLRSNLYLYLEDKSNHLQ